MTEFHSILYPQPQHDATDAGLAGPDAADDIGMNRVIATIAAQRNDCGIEEVFRRPLRTVDEIAYRHEVFADLERDEIRAPFDSFVSGMREMRCCAARTQALCQEFQASRRHLDAVDRYCTTVSDLLRSLSGSNLRSRGLRAFACYLSDYVNGIGFRRLRDDTRSILDELDAVRYTVFVDGRQVSVDRYAGQKDYSAEVAALFTPFAVPNQNVAISAEPAAEFVPQRLNRAEERVLDCVASLYPDIFRAVAGFRDRHTSYMDPILECFDRQIQFYLAYLDYMRRFNERGLMFCRPNVTPDFEGVSVDSGFDVALAEQLIKADEPGDAVVRNDFRLTGCERIMVVTGPNHSGKTAFARMIGQVLSLAAFGVPVPAVHARLPLVDRLFTDCARPGVGTPDEKLTRVRVIVSEATNRSVIVMKDGFGSTAVSDAVQIGTEVLNRIAELRCIAVFVTFLDELAGLGPATVGMTGSMTADDPTHRTFEFKRERVDSRVRTEALARHYGLTYRALSERLSQ